jgi:ABC-2 type transport system ATP-binding protein
MLNVENLTRNYGQLRALNGVSFSAARGEILGLLGPNGAGKSTAMKIITGFLAADEGTVTLETDVHRVEVHASPIAARRLTGWMPEVVPVYEDMRADDYLLFCAAARGVSASDARTRIAEIAAEIGLAPMLARPIRELSRGYRQRCGLAQALLHRPAVLVLDEPTSGLDPTQIAGLHEFLRTLAARDGVTVIFSTHILSEVEAVASRIAVLNRGRLIYDGTRDALVARFTSSSAPDTPVPHHNPFNDAFLALISDDNARANAGNASTPQEAAA